MYFHIFDFVEIKFQSNTNQTDLDHEFYTYKHNLCSWYSRITFYWLTGFLRNCYKHLIQLEDLGQLPNREKSTTQYGRLFDIYLKQKVRYILKTDRGYIHIFLFDKIWSDVLINRSRCLIMFVNHRSFMVRLQKCPCGNVTAKRTGKNFYWVEY